jgi:hypothetical protein
MSATARQDDLISELEAARQASASTEPTRAELRPRAIKAALCRREPNVPIRVR